MFLKTVQHITIVSLKYFFNLDSTLSAHMFLILLVILGLVKISCSKAINELHNGLRTVKDDANNITENIRDLKKQWINRDIHEMIASYTRSLK